MKETANTWEYKVGINAIIANFVWVCENVNSAGSWLSEFHRMLFSDLNSYPYHLSL